MHLNYKLYLKIFNNCTRGGFIGNERACFLYERMGNLAIKNGCRELNLKLPEIYFVELHENVRMYDNEGNIISYDYRDIGYDIKNIKFIPKEYVIYINIELFNNEVNMLVKCYQTIRHAYQIIQAHNKIHSNH